MSSQQRGARSRRLAVTMAAVAASVVLASGPGFAAGTARVADPPAPTPTVTPPVPPIPSVSPVPPIPSVPSVTPVPPVPSVSPVPPVPVTPVPPVKVSPAFGAYLDYGPRGVARIAELSHWLGGAELRVGHTYLPGDRWTNIEGRTASSTSGRTGVPGRPTGCSSSTCP